MKSLNEIIKQLDQGNVPDRFPKRLCELSISNKNWMSIYRYRDLIRTNYGMFALVDNYWTGQLAQWMKTNNINKVLEVQAGKGWLSKALTNHGLEVIATDNFSWSCMDIGIKPFPVINLDRLKAIRKYRNKVDCLVVSWPHFNDEKIVKDLHHWPAHKPIVYIGESGGGCCACEEFFEHFNSIQLKREFDLVSWEGIYDYVWIGYWKK